jgi:hypothetical protein
VLSRGATRFDEVARESKLLRDLWYSPTDVRRLKLDTTTKMWTSYWMLNRHLLLRCDFFGAFTTLLAAGFVLNGSLDSGTAGNVIILSLT